MKTVVALVAAVLAVPLVCVPLMFVVILATLPFWAWLEQAKGIDAMGYHGPREWCYNVTYAVLVAVGYGLLALALVRRRRRPGSSSKPTPLRGEA